MSVYRRFDSELPSLVTSNVAGHRRLFDAATAARMLLDVLLEVKAETGFHLLAFVVMPDHLHLVLGASQSHNVSRIVQLVKGRFSRRYNGATGSSGPLWQSRYHERGLRSERELLEAIQYVHRNPVKAGLAADESDFRWSSASERYATDLVGYLGQAEA